MATDATSLPSSHAAPRTLARADFGQLIACLAVHGYTVVGPTRRDGAIVYDTLTAVEDLPIGWRDEHAPGRYRLAPRDDEALFGYVVGPHSFKTLFHVPRERLVALRKKGRGFEASPEPAGARRLALFGVRACEIVALDVLDRVLMRSATVDPRYAARRADVLVIAVGCNEPGGTCFCVSMGDGPTPTKNFDLALSEIVEGRHRFVVRAGSEAGADLLAELPTVAATNEDLRCAEALSRTAHASMGRRMDTRDIQPLLYEAAEDHPRWQDVASRCLSCTNCTLVCPTCFCSRVEDFTSLDGETAERVRSLDSCFSLDHSYVHGGVVRQSVVARYRQWITHKLATWYDQFGTSGCVGCGRCITWCPAGIDITEEVAAIRATKAGSEAEEEA